MGVIHFTKKELSTHKEYLDIRLDGKEVKTRKIQECAYSGRIIKPGEKAYSLKVFPTSVLGHFVDIEKPFTYYACGVCVECTH